MEKIVDNAKQKLSTYKKEKILQVAYELFKYKGYINTNITEIAKEAGISTSYVHSNYKDKKEILMECLSKVDRELTVKICDKISGISDIEDIFSLAKKVVKIIIELHSGEKIYHYDVMSLQYNDEDFKNYFKDVENKMMTAISTQLKKIGLAFTHESEQTFLLFSLIRGIEDELYFNLNPNINREILIDECARIITSMITKEKKL